MTDQQMVDSYPGGVGRRLGMPAAWIPALAARQSGVYSVLMPRMNELPEGLEAMLT